MRKLLHLSETTLLIGVLLIAVALRLPVLSGSFWLDEAAQALESARPLSQQLQIKDDFQPPLLHLILHFSLYLGDSEWWLRTVGALIPAIITILFTYKLGQKLFDEKTALLAGLLLVTSTFHIFYSQELRPYSLPAAWAAISWFVLIVGWKEQRGYKKSELLVVTFASVAGLYSSYLYPFLLLSQLIWLWTQNRQHIKQWLWTFAVTILLFLPWLPIFAGQLSAGQVLQSSLPGWSSVVSPPQLKALSLVAAKFVYGSLDVRPTPIFVGLTGLILGTATLITIKLMCKEKRQQLSPIIFWLCLPILSAWLISFWIPILQAKRVLFSLPACYLFLAGLVFYSKQLRLLQKLSYVLVFLVLSINLFSVYAYWSHPQLQRENWRDLITQIQQQFPDHSVALFSFSAPFAPWRWYANADYPAIATGELFLNEQTAEKTIQQLLEYDHILVFDYLRDLTDPDHLLDQYILEAGYQNSGYLDYSQIGFVRIYSRPAAVISYGYDLRTCLISRIPLQVNRFRQKK
ncbi:MAG: hypothetical protein COY81_00390 [Candidatus Pacebacteria bacterium CG_4_10_14_0_8_um_filter_43_12]|nr:MAG: hypothetical protein COY81_00390 [Candidatus Pacebacteria bacterium CG_4_10_14_0_8_um_filter_43_12]